MNKFRSHNRINKNAGAGVSIQTNGAVEPFSITKLTATTLTAAPVALT
jgi:hypothetical protein